MLCASSVLSRHHRQFRIIFGLSDVLLMALAFELAYRTRLALPLERVFYLVLPVKGLLLGAACALWPLVGTWLKIYERLDAERAWVIIRDTIRQCALGGIALVMIEYILRLDLSRSFLGLFLVYGWILLCVFRLNAPQLVGWFRRGFGEPHYVLVTGTGPRARRLGEALERSANHGIRLMGFIAADSAEKASQIHLSRIYPVHPLEELPKLLERNVVDEILFAVDSKRLADLEDVLLLCDEDGVRIRVAVDFIPHVNSDVYLERLQSIPLLTFSAAPHDEVRLMVKRLLDVMLAAAALVVLAPFMLLIGIVIRLTSPGPVIFCQQRRGLNGRQFKLYKFRSMCENAEELKPALKHLNQKQPAFKIPNDPRMTPIGRYLRKFSIDEWPQLWNILKGDMSLVGPRPPLLEEAENYQPWQRRRLRMRPGLTCIWALEGRDKLEFDAWMRKDLEYIDNWSLSLDWKVLLKTIPRVLTGKGAH